MEYFKSLPGTVTDTNMFTVTQTTFDTNMFTVTQYIYQNKYRQASYWLDQKSILQA